jgi:hypothetical protein
VRAGRRQERGRKDAREGLENGTLPALARSRASASDAACLSIRPPGTCMHVSSTAPTRSATDAAQSPLAFLEAATSVVAAAAAQGERILAHPVPCSADSAAMAIPPVSLPPRPARQRHALAEVGSQPPGKASSETSRQPRQAFPGSSGRQAQSNGDTRSLLPPPARAAGGDGAAAAAAACRGEWGPPQSLRRPLARAGGAPTVSTAAVAVGLPWPKVDCRTSAGRFPASAEPEPAAGGGDAQASGGGGGRAMCPRRSRRAWNRE